MPMPYTISEVGSMGFARERRRGIIRYTTSYNYQRPNQNRITAQKLYGYDELMFDSTHSLRLLGIKDCGGPMYHEFSGFTSLGAPRLNIVSWKGYADLNPPLALTGAPLAAIAVDQGEDSLWSLGSKAVAATNPSNPAFSLSTALGELREGVPKLIGHSLLRDRAHLARGAGKEYLNVEFGWKPLIRDLKDLGHLVLNSDKIRAQYVRDSGNAVHRRWTPPGGDEIDVVTYAGSALATYGTGFSVAVGGTQTNTHLRTTRFSGAFRYYIPEPRDAGSRWRRWNMLGRQMAGLSVNSLPETVWNLAPWTWLVDWHGDIGSLITNITTLGSDSQQLTYGYLTRRAVSTRQVRTTVLPTVSTPEWRGLPVEVTYSQGVTRRVKATPYGFGLGEVDYSPRQLAILAALGLAKS